METKTSDNGVVRIPRCGILKTAIGDGPIFEIDVQRTYDEWYQADWDMRDAEGKLANNQHVAWGEMRRAFVQNIIAVAVQKVEPSDEAIPIISSGEAMVFIARIGEEVKKLRLFIEPLTHEPASSASNTEIRFSQ